MVRMSNRQPLAALHVVGAVERAYLASWRLFRVSVESVPQLEENDPQLEVSVLLSGSFKCNFSDRRLDCLSPLLNSYDKRFWRVYW
jgi:hypothetical protein